MILYHIPQQVTAGNPAKAIVVQTAWRKPSLAAVRRTVSLYGNAACCSRTDGLGTRLDGIKSQQQLARRKAGKLCVRNPLALAMGRFKSVNKKCFSIGMQEPIALDVFGKKDLRKNLLAITINLHTCAQKK